MASYLVDSQSIRLRQKRAVVSGEEARHAIKVARRRVGEEIWLIDGCGTAYEARVGTIGDGRVECELVREVPGWGEPAISVTLAAAALKHDRFDMLVEKAVELGVDAIWPVETANSVVRSPSDKKLQRWQSISRSATKQCRRCRVPVVEAPRSFAELVERVGEFDEAFVAWEEEASARIGKISGPSVLILIGPEGGFRENEIDASREAGMQPVSLGPRRLRAETAAMYALAVAMHESADGAPDAAL